MFFFFLFGCNFSPSFTLGSCSAPVVRIWLVFFPLRNFFFFLIGSNMPVDRWLTRADSLHFQEIFQREWDWFAFWFPNKFQFCVVPPLILSLTANSVAFDFELQLLSPFVVVNGVLFLFFAISSDDQTDVTLYFWTNEQNRTELNWSTEEEREKKTLYYFTKWLLDHFIVNTRNKKKMLTS